MTPKFHRPYNLLQKIGTLVHLGQISMVRSTILSGEKETSDPLKRRFT